MKPKSPAPKGKPNFNSKGAKKPVQPKFAKGKAPVYKMPKGSPRGR